MFLSSRSLAVRRDPQSSQQNAVRYALNTHGRCWRNGAAPDTRAGNPRGIWLRLIPFQDRLWCRAPHLGHGLEKSKLSSGKTPRTPPAWSGHRARSSTHTLLRADARLFRNRRSVLHCPRESVWFSQVLQVQQCFQVSKVESSLKRCVRTCRISESTFVLHSTDALGWVMTRCTIFLRLIGTCRPTWSQGIDSCSSGVRSIRNSRSRL